MAQGDLSRLEAIFGGTLNALARGLPPPKEWAAWSKRPTLLGDPPVDEPVPPGGKRKDRGTDNQIALYVACQAWTGHGRGREWAGWMLGRYEEVGLCWGESGATYSAFHAAVLRALRLVAGREGWIDIAARAAVLERQLVAYLALFLVFTGSGRARGWHSITPGVRRSHDWSDAIDEGLYVALGLPSSKPATWWADAANRRNLWPTLLRLPAGGPVLSRGEQQLVMAWSQARDSFGLAALRVLLAGARLRWQTFVEVLASGELRAYLEDTTALTNDLVPAVVLGRPRGAGERVDVHVLRRGETPCYNTAPVVLHQVDGVLTARFTGYAVRDGRHVKYVDAPASIPWPEGRVVERLELGPEPFERSLEPAAPPAPAPPAEPEPAPQPAPSPGSELEAARAAVLDQLAHAQRLLEQPAVPWRRVAARLEAGAAAARRHA